MVDFQVYLDAALKAIGAEVVQHTFTRRDLANAMNEVAQLKEQVAKLETRLKEFESPGEEKKPGPEVN